MPDLSPYSTRIHIHVGYPMQTKYIPSGRFGSMMLRVGSVMLCVVSVMLRVGSIIYSQFS